MARKPPDKKTCQIGAWFFKTWLRPRLLFGAEFWRYPAGAWLLEENPLRVSKVL